MREISLSARQIRDFLGASANSGKDAHGDLCIIQRVSSIQAASADALVFAVDAVSLAAAIDSPAALILAPEESAGAEIDGGSSNSRIISVAEPRTAFALVYQNWFREQAVGVLPDTAISPAAMIDSAASIGEGVRIGPGAVIEAGVTIGKGSIIGPRVVIHAGTTLGRRVRVQAGAVLGSDGFGYVRTPAGYVGFPQVGTLVIEDDVEIGANATIDRGALGETRIGRGTKIDNLVHIAHNCTLGENVIVAAQAGIAGSTVVESDVILGGQAGLGEHVTIRKGTILGGQSGVLSGKDFRGRPGEIFFGTPARPVRQFMRELARLARGH